MLKPIPSVILISLCGLVIRVTSSILLEVVQSKANLLHVFDSNLFAAGVVEEIYLAFRLAQKSTRDAGIVLFIFCIIGRVFCAVHTSILI